MNHYEGNHWASYHFASNHFWGEGAAAPVAVVDGAGWTEIMDLDGVRKKIRTAENNQRAALLIALAEADEL